MRRSFSFFFTLSLFSCAVFGGGDDEPTDPSSTPTTETPGTPAPPLDGTPTEDQITEKYGVFVVPNIAPGGDGTRAKPFATIAEGLARGYQTSKRVYVCTGTFNEAITVANGISMVGGFDCTRATWPITSERTRVLAPTSPAITAANISAPTRIEGFEIVAPDGSDAAPTSIGLRATNAGPLVFAKSRIVAGKGKDGAAGEEGIQLTLGATAKGTASDAQVAGPYNTFLGFPSYREGAAGGIPSCVGATVDTSLSAGGKGGKGGSYDSQNTCPPASICGWYWKLATCGAIPCAPQSASQILKTPGNAGTDGTSATSPGTLTADGFTPRDGTAGTNGTAGTGGPGGAGGAMDSAYAAPTNAAQQYGYGATGPGGGAGGCPGLAGKEGKGGGASIGALLVSSKGLTFDATEIVAAAGGAGGKGAFGSDPTSGGAPGEALGAAGAAEAGAPGGRSGISGSGAGGSSYGIAATLGDPTLANGASAKAGPAGEGVPAETKNDALGNPKTWPASASGEAKDQLGF